MATKAKELVQEKGILATPDVKLVHVIYKSDEVSRIMPGKKDFVSVQQNGQ